MSMSDASGNGQISTINTGKWLKRLDQTNMSYFCWSLTNKNESSALLVNITVRQSRQSGVARATCPD